MYEEDRLPAFIALKNTTEIGGHPHITSTPDPARAPDLTVSQHDNEHDVLKGHEETANDGHEVR